ncbi:MAG: hypothetical protein JSW13_04450, partial [Candidatus Aerophobus sp.]
MKKILIPFLIGCFLVMGLSIFTTFAEADTVVVLGEPVEDPIGGEPPQDVPPPPPETPPDPEPPPETPPEPEPISATVNITPKT